MDEIIAGILGVFEIFLFFDELYNPRDLIEAEGFRPEDSYPEEMIRFAPGFFGLDVRKVHHKEEPGGTMWLLELVHPKNKRKSLFVLVYHIDGTNCPTLAALRPKVPANHYMRKNSECTLGALIPLPRRLSKSLNVRGWKAFAVKKTLPDDAILQRLRESLQSSDGKKLCGVSLSGPYLLVWSDARNVQRLLRAGPGFGRTLFSATNS